MPEPVATNATSFLRANDHYCILVIETVRTTGITFPLIFSDTFQILDHLPIEPNAVWRKDEGEFFWKGIEESRLFVIVRQPTDKPSIQPENNFKKPLTAFMRGLLLNGIPWSDGQTFLTGTVYADRTVLSEVDKLVQFRLNLKLPRDRTISESRLRTAYDLGQNILALQAAGWSRIGTGFHTLIDAFSVYWWEERLHMFIRAMDAVVKSAFRSGVDNFQKRCGSTFLAPHSDNDEVLQDMYFMRNAIEHIHNIEKEPQRLKHNSKAREETRDRRIRQLELMVLAVYRRILGDPQLLADLGDDTRIDAFWKLSDSDRFKRWNDPLNLDSIR